MCCSFSSLTYWAVMTKEVWGTSGSSAWNHWFFTVHIRPLMDRAALEWLDPFSTNIWIHTHTHSEECELLADRKKRLERETPRGNMHLLSRKLDAVSHNLSSAKQLNPNAIVVLLKNVCCTFWMSFNGDKRCGLSINTFDSRLQPPTVLHRVSSERKWMNECSLLPLSLIRCDPCTLPS